MAECPQVEVIAGRLNQLRLRMAAVGGEKVKIVVVTKGHDHQMVKAALTAGCNTIGESYSQELASKYQTLVQADVAPMPQVHFIGGLQRNKIRKIASLVDVWQSVDRIEVGKEIARCAPKAHVLLQVNPTADANKGGCAVSAVPQLLEELTNLQLRVVGLMGIAPMGSPDCVRSAFKLLRSLVDQHGLKECSMGMSGDLEIAIEQGATMIRIGTALLGARASK